MPRTFCLSAVVAAGLLAFPSPAPAQDATTVIARVGDVEITLGHAIAALQELPEQLRAAPDDRLFPALVGQLIDQELLAQSQTELAMADRIRLENSRRDFLSNLALQTAIQDAVNEESLAIAYEAFSETFAQGEPVTEWNAAHILVRTREEIDAVVAQLDEGREFAEVAGEVSIDGSGRQGGELGWFGPGVMIPEFEETVRNLESGEVSEPLETRFGWHVVRLLDSRLASVPPLAEVQNELAGELRRTAMQELIAGLRAGTEVENLSEGVDPALMRQQELLAP